MADYDLVARLKRDVKAWNHWRQVNRDCRVDLRAADLRGADLRNADLSEVNLYYAGLVDTNLASADLSEADLSSANLLGANFTGADLTAANLGFANLGGTLFIDTNLSRAHGLDTCLHHGPSTVDHWTVGKSGGLPPLFLRGCGLPDEQISILSSPNPFRSCFISYASADQDFTNRLHFDLQRNGVRCWFAPHDIQCGRKIEEQISHAIRSHDRLLIVLSNDSIASEWVQMEIDYARQREVDERRQILFPISLVPFTRLRDWTCRDPATGKDSAREIKQYFIPDFSNWKDSDSYKAAFDRLLRDLKAKQSVPAAI